MEIFSLKNLTFKYPNGKLALDNINLSIKQGEYVLLCGKSASGKTTLLRSLKPVIAPHGEIGGNILYCGKDISSLSPNDSARQIGFVFQNPDNQIVCDTVWHELTFGLESLGMPQEKMRLKVAETASFFGLTDLLDRKISTLSGGQKQQVALAGVAITAPKVLLLDEPTSSLDPIAASEFLQLIRRVNRELGTTVIITEHRLENVFEEADKVVILNSGKIDCVLPPRQCAEQLMKNKSAMIYSLPAPAQIAYKCGEYINPPLNVREGRQWIDNHDALIKKTIDFSTYCGNTAVQLKNVWFRYEKSSPDVLRGLSLDIPSGCVFAIVGGMGTGKSTILSLISKQNKPYRGKVITDAKCSYLPQDPTLLIKSDDDFELSGGELQLKAFERIMSLDADILLLDEPTSGCDALIKIKLGMRLKEAAKSGKTIVIVSHDIDFCAEYADICAMPGDGVIASVGETHKFLAGNDFYTTSANLITRHVYPYAVTNDEAATLISEDSDNIITLPNETDLTILQTTTAELTQSEAKHNEIKNAKINRRHSMIAAVICILSGAATIIFGGDRYYAVSTILVVLTLIPFMLTFESSAHKSREIVMTSVLIALIVASRGAFFMFQQIKPMAALIIICGIAFGAEKGFFIGSVSTFVSNFFFGQGPWTPWQMLCFGLIGFFAGILFAKKRLPKTVPVCIYGALSVIIIYGGIMNPASILIMQSGITFSAIAASWAVGFYFDVIHAASTVIFLSLLTKPMLTKLYKYSR